MHLQFMPAHEMEDPFDALADIPKHMLAYFVPNSKRQYYQGQAFDYLEQYYGGEERRVCWLDVDCSADRWVSLRADEPMLIVLHMLRGTAQAVDESNSDRFILREGFAYLIYLSGHNAWKLFLRRGTYRLVYCALELLDLSHVAIRDEKVNALIQKFSSRSAGLLIGDPAQITQNAIYNMWLVQQCREEEGFRQMYFRVRCLDLMLEYLKHLPYGDVGAVNAVIKDIPRIEKIFEAKRILDEYESGRIDGAALARQVGLNLQLLARLFKQNFKTTIGQYQIEVRFERARRLLVTTDLSISEIAATVGYEDESSLTRLFVARTGANAKAYRDRFSK